MKKIGQNSGVHVWLVMMKSHQALWKYALGSIEASGICFSDFGAMEMLLNKGPQPINSIGERLGLTSGALTAVVDRLEKKELVVRKSHPEDRRVRMVELTDAGRTMISEVFRQHSLDMEKVAEALDSDERAELIRLLKKIGKHATNL